MPFKMSVLPATPGRNRAMNERFDRKMVAIVFEANTDVDGKVVDSIREMSDLSINHTKGTYEAIGSFKIATLLNADDF